MNIGETTVSLLLCYLCERIPKLFHSGVPEFVFGDVHLQEINKEYALYLVNIPMEYTFV